MSITQAIEKAKKEETKIRYRLLEIADEIPENPNAKKIDGCPHCAIVNSKSLGNIWSAEYHIFESQKKVIKDFIKKAENLESILNFLTTIAEKGKIIMKGTVSHTFHFHPIVQNYVKEKMI